MRICGMIKVNLRLEEAGTVLYGKAFTWELVPQSIGLWEETVPVKLTSY